MIKQLQRNSGNGILSALPLEKLDVSEVVDWAREHPLAAAGAAAGAIAVLSLVLESGQSDRSNGHLEVGRSGAAGTETPSRGKDLSHRVLRGLAPRRLLSEAASSWRIAPLMVGAGRAGWISWLAGVVGKSVGESLNRPN